MAKSRFGALFSSLQSAVSSLHSQLSSSRLLRHRWRQQHSVAGCRPLLGAAIRRCWLLAGTLEIVRQAHERGTVPLIFILRLVHLRNVQLCKAGLASGSE